MSESRCSAKDDAPGFEYTGRAALMKANVCESEVKEWHVFRRLSAAPLTEWSLYGIDSLAYR